MKIISLLLMLLLLNACSTMNSHFSCNVTAGDSCLTIEQVDAMTRFADAPIHAPKNLRHKINSSRKPKPYLAQNSQAIWIVRN